MYSGAAEEKVHTITVSGKTIMRDGKAVRIKANTHTRELQIGCTKVSRAALVRLEEMATNSDLHNEITIQEGEA